MTNEMTANIMATLGALYPNYDKEGDTKIKASLWSSLLSDYPDEIVSVCFKSLLQKMTFAPKPADLINEINSRYATSNNERWSRLADILWAVEEYRIASQTDSNARYKITEIWNGLRDDEKKWLGSMSEMLVLGRMTDKELKFEKGRFLKTFVPDVEPDEIIANYQLAESKRERLGDSNGQKFIAG